MSVRLNYRRRMNQVSYESRGYYYKYYISSQYTFDHLIRKSLYKIYSDLGIKVVYRSYKYQGKYVEVIKKPKLDICTTEEPEILYKDFSRILNQLKIQLKINLIESQIKDYYPKLSYLSLSLAQYPECSDYFKFNSHYYLLDDEGFIVILIDESNKIITSKSESYFIFEYPLNGELISSSLVSHNLISTNFLDPFKLNDEEFKFVPIFDLDPIRKIRTLNKIEYQKYSKLLESIES